MLSHAWSSSQNHFWWWGASSGPTPDLQIWSHQKKKLPTIFENKPKPGRLVPSMGDDTGKTTFTLIKTDLYFCNRISVFHCYFYIDWAQAAVLTSVLQVSTHRITTSSRSYWYPTCLPSPYRRPFCTKIWGFSSWP